MKKKPAEPVPLPQRIAEWLTRNPGSHRPVDIAAGLGVETRPVANECPRMYQKGILHRSRPAGVSGSGPGVRYEMLRD